MATTTITCEFHLGQTVYFLFENKVQTGDVRSIFVTRRSLPLGACENVITYALDSGVPGIGNRPEKTLFASKQALLESL